MKRTILDSSGRHWEIWAVNPADLGRFIYDRRTFERTDGTEAAREVPAVHPELRDGWLCFQSAAERRRFAPIPPGWDELPESVLRVMLDVAAPVTRVLGAANPSASE